MALLILYHSCHEAFYVKSDYTPVRYGANGGIRKEYDIWRNKMKHEERDMKKKTRSVQKAKWSQNEINCKSASRRREEYVG